MNLPFFRPREADTLRGELAAAHIRSRRAEREQSKLRYGLMVAEIAVTLLQNQLERERLRKNHKRLPVYDAKVAETTRRLREGR